MTQEEYLELADRHAPYITWCEGGSSGGDCWGGESELFGGDEKPDYKPHVAKFLKNFNIRLTDDQISKIFDSHRYISIRRWTDNEYYGNYYHQAAMDIDVGALWPIVEMLRNSPDFGQVETYLKLMR